jgi:hypothetical protein
MAKLLFFACLLAWAIGLVKANDAWFSAKFPINGKFYPVTARIHSQKTGDSIKFSSELQYRAKDTSFFMHTTGVYNTAKESPVWQNTVRDGVYSVEWSFRDYSEKPAAIYWRNDKSNGTITFENDALPEEFLYFLTEKVDSVTLSKEIKVLSPVWEMPFEPNAWYASAKYTGQKIRIQGVDCYQVVYTRSDGARAEYYVTLKGKQIWRFQTFRGVWFDRVQ